MLVRPVAFGFTLYKMIVLLCLTLATLAAIKILQITAIPHDLPYLTRALVLTTRQSVFVLFLAFLLSLAQDPNHIFGVDVAGAAPYRCHRN